MRGTPPESTADDHSRGFAVGYATVISSSTVHNLHYGFTRASYGILGDTNVPWNTFIGLDQGIVYSQNYT